jgi:protein-arginine kinase activator protein McsA
MIEQAFFDVLQDHVNTPYANGAAIPLTFFIIDVLMQRIDELEEGLNMIVEREELSLRAIVQDEIIRDREFVR